MGAGKVMGKSIGGALYLWRTTGKQLVRVPVDSALRTLALTRRGRWIVTGHEDSTILGWDVAGLLADVKE